MNDMRGPAIKLLFGGIGVTMVTAGAVMTVCGLRGRREIRDELIRQKIVFPEKGQGALDGRTVRNGAQARAFGDMIGGNVRKATGGRTYAEVGHDLQAAGGQDEKLAALRQTAFMGETLRASLMSAYQAWEVTSLTVGLGTVLIISGGGFVAIAAKISDIP